MSERVARRLVMWDIDLTLLRVRGVTRQAYAAAFAQVTGTAPETYPNFAGRTDLDAAHEVFALHGIVDADIPAFLGRYAAEYVARAHLIPHSGVLLPGARAVIDALAGRADIVQTTVTGNIPEVARLKLAAFGLDAVLDLTVGGYGTEARVRAPLVAASRQRAEAKYGPFDEVVVVGDTVHDVAAALACDAVPVGVASGGTPAGALAAAGAHAVLDSLADTPVVVAVLTTGNRRGAVPYGAGPCQDSSCPPHPSRPVMAPSPPPKQPM